MPTCSPECHLARDRGGGGRHRSCECVSVRNICSTQIRQHFGRLAGGDDDGGRYGASRCIQTQHKLGGSVVRCRGWLMRRFAENTPHQNTAARSAPIRIPHSLHDFCAALSSSSSPSSTDVTRLARRSRCLQVCTQRRHARVRCVRCVRVINVRGHDVLNVPHVGRRRARVRVASLSLGHLETTFMPVKCILPSTGLSIL